MTTETIQENVDAIVSIDPVLAQMTANLAGRRAEIERKYGRPQVPATPWNTECSDCGRTSPSGTIEIHASNCPTLLASLR